jgi:hypothetical protein
LVPNWRQNSGCRAIDFENLAKYVTPELAYILEIERFEAKVGGSKEITLWLCG